MTAKRNDPGELIALAIEAQKRAYVPYSHFRVGAVAEDERGRCFTGCNIENASYPAGICAERTAVFKAISEGAEKICRLALVSDADEYARPCGICRQVLAEHAAEDFVCLAAKPDGTYRELCLEELLPAAFSKDSLSRTKRPSAL